MNLGQRFILACCLSSITFWLSANTDNFNTQSNQYENHISALYQLNEAERDYDQIKLLTNELDSYLTKLSPTGRAKAFLLAASEQIHKGNSHLAFEFASKAKQLNNIPEQLTLESLLKLAQTSHAKGQFKYMLDTARQAESKAQSLGLTVEQVLALSYQAIASASLSQNQATSSILDKVTGLVKNTPEVCDHAKIIENLALVHGFNKDYQNALSLQLKLIAIREKQANNKDLDRAYYNLGGIYRKLGRFHDAYNAYWGSKNYANRNAEPLKIAYAELGMGEVLLSQKKYEQAFDLLSKAEKIFQGQNLTKPYIQSIIALAEAAVYSNNNLLAAQLLTEAKALIAKTQIKGEQIRLYKLFSEVYKQQNDYHQAYAALEKHLELTRISQKQQVVKSKQLVPSTPAEINPLTQSLTVSTERLKEYQNDQELYFKLITLLIVISFTLLLLLMRFYYRLRHHQIHHSHYVYHDESALLANFDYTKQIYQRLFKQARKYQYPFSVALITVDNWDNITQKLDQKGLSEVDAAIAKIIVRSISETDCAGHLSAGEYLILCEHQSTEDIAQKIDKINDGIASVYFARQPYLSITLNIAFDSPTMQDIDPYQFLAKLSKSLQS